MVALSVGSATRRGVPVPVQAVVLAVALVAVACQSPPASKSAAGGGAFEGSLEATDPRLSAGEHYDEYPLTAAVGERITVDLTASGFDPYLVLVSPSGEWLENDDHEGSTERSRIAHVAQESGRWRVWATSLEPDRVGPYHLEIRTEAVDLPGHRFHRGALEPGDEELRGGELADRIPFQGRQGEYVWIDLRSAEMDPYLVLRGPDGQQVENDDHGGSLHRSVVGTTLPLDGTYEVIVTSARPGETGAWDLTLRQLPGGGRSQRREAGELVAGDATLRTGEWVDEFTVNGVPRQDLALRLTSEEFDPYLVLIGPDGERLENDDAGEGTASALRTRLTAPGPHRVLVTSFELGEGGRYALEIDLGEVRPAAEPEVLALGDRRSGRLEPDDEVLPGGERVDFYVFEGEAGTPVEIVLASEEVDTYLMLRFPDGTVLQNDDDWDREGRSRLELTLSQGGRYEVAATSYGAGEEGEYRLELRRAAAGRLPPVRGAADRTLALLVGISDYGGRLSDLDRTADDAVRLRDALLTRTGLAAEDAVLLVDDGATVDRFRRSLEALAARMTVADQLVLFYSGHGGRLRRSGPQPADPDAVDETLSLYDGELTDDELAALLDAVPGRVLLVLDSCFAGGFSKDVITVPGRMGVFSSEEDVTSSVADKFRAGGFLAVFLAEALEGDWADDGDGQLTALELSHYLHERYRTDVKGGGPDDYVRTEGPHLGYQRLVVDRGSLGPADVLFRLR